MRFIALWSQNRSFKVEDKCKAACARKAKPRATQAACTIYTVLHTLIDVHRSYVPFWLLGVVGADLRPDNKKLNFMSH
jgi:hypothetical protein